MASVEILVADITTLNVDAIVNAANTSLLGGGGVDGAINRAAGPELLQFNRRLGGCEVGEVRISPGFQLSALWVISTVGPIWSGGGHGEAELLAACYRKALTAGLEKSCRSIAFPAISTGVYGYPKRQASSIAMMEMSRFGDRYERIIACCFSEQDAAVYRACFI